MEYKGVFCAGKASCAVWVGGAMMICASGHVAPRRVASGGDETSDSRAGPNLRVCNAVKCCISYSTIPVSAPSLLHGCVMWHYTCDWLSAAAGTPYMCLYW